MILEVYIKQKKILNKSVSQNLSEQKTKLLTIFFKLCINVLCY